MTDPLLTYQTPEPRPSTPLLTGTWIYILVLGCIYCLAGICLGGSTLLAFSFITHVAPAGAGPPRGTLMTIMIITGLIMFLLPAGSGGAFIWSALRIRRGSRPAAITALVIAILNGGGLLILVCLGAIGMAMRSDSDPSAFVGVLFYLLPVGMNIAAIVLITRLLAQWRRAAY